MRAHASQAAAAVLEAFPPRGIIRLLPPEHTSHGKPQIERLVAEEYILDTLAFFEGDRVQCAQRLAGELLRPASPHTRSCAACERGCQGSLFSLGARCLATMHRTTMSAAAALQQMEAGQGCQGKEGRMRNEQVLSLEGGRGAVTLLQGCRFRSSTRPCWRRCCLRRCCAFLSRL